MWGQRQRRGSGHRPRDTGAPRSWQRQDGTLLGPLEGTSPRDTLSPEVWPAHWESKSQFAALWAAAPGNQAILVRRKHTASPAGRSAGRSLPLQTAQGMKTRGSLGSPRGNSLPHGSWKGFWGRRTLVLELVT